MDIGARLKEARVSKELSLDQLQEMTKIQKRYLSAIEEGKFEVLPGKFYAKAFIKEYANAVGIDPNELLEEHKEDMPKTEMEDEPYTIEYSRMERSRKGNVEKNSKLFSVFPAIIVVLLIIGIIFVIWFFRGDNSADGEDVLDDTEIIINNPNELDGDTEDELVEEKKEDVEMEEEVQEEDKLDEDTEEETDLQFTVVERGTGSSPQSTIEINKALEEVILTLETESRTWLDVEKDNGESLFSSSFEAENSPLELDLSGTSQIYLNIGNTSDLKIMINGVELEYPVDPNDVVHQRLWIYIPEETE